MPPIRTLLRFLVPAFLAMVAPVRSMDTIQRPSQPNAATIVQLRPDGWEESIVASELQPGYSPGEPLRLNARSRIWKKGLRTFQVAKRNPRQLAETFDEYHSTNLSYSAPQEGSDWAVDTLRPPPDGHGLLPWIARPGIWSYKHPAEVVGMGRAYLESEFWWTSPDTLETRASILLSPEWSRALGRESLEAWVKLHRTQSQILTDTTPWRPRICDFRIQVQKFLPFHLTDTTWLGTEDEPIFWNARCKDDSMTMVLEGPLLLGHGDPVTSEATRRYRRAIATARGLLLDTGATECRILSRKNGITFTVDDVIQNKPEYATEDSGWIHSARSIAREGIERTLPTSDVHPPEILEADLHPIASHHTPSPLVKYGENPFLGTFILAWNNHLPVRITPDHLWMAILNGVSLHAAKEPKKWRKLLKIGIGSQREPKLHLDPQILASRDSIGFWEETSRRLLAAMPDSTQQLLEEHFLAKYSTTTPTIEVAYRLKILESLQPSFDDAGNVECGIPHITLEGTPDDWIQLRTRARRLSKLGLTKWMQALEPVLTEFIKSSQGTPSLPFWRSFFRENTGNNGCDLVTQIDGWITHFFPVERNHGDLRFRKNLAGTLNLHLVPKGAGSIPFTLVDPSRSSGSEHHYRFVSGFVGVAQDSATGDLSPDIGWVVFEDSTKRK